MKLLYLLLAHDRPEEAAELARTLVRSSTDGRVIIHFDAKSPVSQFGALETAVAGEARISLVRARVEAVWGDYSLVQATINALTEARAGGQDYDYAILLSGACLPCRPIAQLERYLSENRGREFIEVGDESWPTGGLRLERFHQYFPLKPLRHRWLGHTLVQLQRFLGVRRKMPDKLVPRFGSQWWALSWQTCTAILDYLAAHPEVPRFFRLTWIPDELMFPTLVQRLAPAKAIAGFSLTHYQFSTEGRPIVFYDDHGDYPFSVERFFFRKVSNEAPRLRGRALQIASQPDDGRPLGNIGLPNGNYLVKTLATALGRPPGQLFRRDQFVDRPDTVLQRIDRPFVVLFGDTDVAKSIMDRLSEVDSFSVVGHVFSPREVDFASNRERLGGLQRTDVAIRDADPALFLTRVLSRCPGVPVLAMAPGEHAGLLQSISQAQSSLVVSLIPLTGNAISAFQAASGHGWPEAPDIPAYGTDRLAEAATLLRMFDRESALAWQKDMERGSGQAALRSYLGPAWTRHLNDELLVPHAHASARVLHAPLPGNPDRRMEAAFRSVSMSNPFRFDPWFEKLVDVVADCVYGEIRPADWVRSVAR